MTHTDNEQAYFDRIRHRIADLKQHLIGNTIPTHNDPVLWFEYIAKIRLIQGNSSNDQSFLSTLLAKNYLMGHFDLSEYDAAEKAQGASGLDIDITTKEGLRIVGEIKTTVPYGKNDLGSAQRTSFRKDFKKLNEAEAQYKFFFVTSRHTLEIVKQLYVDEIPDVEIVLLIDR